MCVCVRAAFVQILSDVFVSTDVRRPTVAYTLRLFVRVYGCLPQIMSLGHRATGLDLSKCLTFGG